MEFNEKLQQLRKQNDMTQEQLAELLYVSRTAISKWENGKGYPNIESLKSISKLFSVSIDELLSGEELITLAVNENRSNIHKIFGLINAALDLAVIAFIFLPLYGKSDGTYIHSVNLFSFTDTTPINLAIYWAVFTIIIVFGIAQFIFSYIEKEKWQGLSAKFSFIIEAFSICFFAAAKEPYVTALLFIQFLIKVLLLKKSAQMK
ncbi:MAG TPA: XRE family transcriptional regulator [Clostridiales bacterium]|jgi:transcriptional regulator with XRE-family HTH domain|uniref:DNA-binding XRE family transcriptional regulator n=3 Tax=root TaxID=1 RepID=A0A4R3KH86_9FIRM|nr:MULTISPECIES: helix-turn-helix transcriptional regulator [Bacillota]QAT60149.1 XRE family transcriptional regulator [Acidilutibacter cellobiosedens]TCS82744.1 DNA-binding XRE family transcriptional regulator [Muricomes intestini]HBI73773.1 XRE family transcriptional regulator [Lachnospiraceae bacterium]HCS75239.1 XRE family transcriptional regulator [Clostridiales bacterium]